MLCAPASKSRCDQKPSILFFLFNETGLPVTHPTDLSLNFSTISFIAFLLTQVSPSVKIQILPFNILNTKFSA